MALSEGNVILASDFIALKARVKAECARRKYNGSVEAYAGSAYDYTVEPTEDKVPLPEHFNKIIVPMNAMINTGRTQTQSGYIVRAMNDINTAITKLESISITSSNSGCKSSCTGLCQGTCTTGCTGCSSTCSVRCGGNCSGSCYQVCFTNCDTYCTDACTMVCQFSCEADCEGSCKGGCKTACKGTCVGGNNVSPN